MEIVIFFFKNLRFFSKFAGPYKPRLHQIQSRFHVNLWTNLKNAIYLLLLLLLNELLSGFGCRWRECILNLTLLRLYEITNALGMVWKISSVAPLILIMMNHKPYCSEVQSIWVKNRKCWYISNHLRGWIAFSYALLMVTIVDRQMRF